ncbi:hypothetical protein QQ045_012677 [Rhodiola kirilowii]
MSGLGSERERQWNIYTSSDSNQPNRYLNSSMNAISFGLVATAILISMFFIMAVFEHLFIKPSQPDTNTPASPSSSNMMKPIISSDTNTAALCMSGFSVVMPGRYGPTHFAKPAPLPPPCSREGINWPHHHEQHYASSPS